MSPEEDLAVEVLKDELPGSGEAHGWFEEHQLSGKI